MELLSVKVKKGRLDKAADAFKTYVVLKVQNLKSTTIDRRGSEPCWEQDFMFEICADGKGFIIELWKKGLLWDSILGVLWIPLATVKHATDEGPGSWWTLHSEVIKNGSEIQGTKTPTSHEILLDVYFALPFDTQKDLDCRGWHRGTPLQGARCSHQDTYDSLSTMESGLSIKESELRRNKDQADESNFAKARWARAIQKQPSLFEAMLMKQLSPLSSILSENLRGMEDESLPMPNHNKLYSWNWLKKYHRQKEQAAQEDQETKHS